MVCKSNLKSNIWKRENVDYFLGYAFNMLPKKMLRIFFFCFIALFFGGGIFNSNVDAEVYYVSVQGNDDDPGTMAHPWQHISYAFKNIVPGDTVYILAGSYAEDKLESRVSGTENSPITLIGANKDTSIILGRWYIKHPYYIIKNLCFDGTALANAGSIILQGKNASHCIIEDNKFVHCAHGVQMRPSDDDPHGIIGPAYNIIRNNDFSHSHANGSITISGPGNIIENNIFHDLDGWDALRAWGVGTVIRDNIFRDLPSGSEVGISNHADVIQTFQASSDVYAYNLVFERNTIINSHAQFGNLTAGGSLHMHHWTFKNNLLINSRAQVNIYIPYVFFYNNTVIGNVYSNGFRFAYDPDWGQGSGDYGKVFNNIFIRCKGYYSFNPGNPHCEADYNLYTSSTDGQDPHGKFSEAHGINGGYTPDQVFVDPENNNFRLVSGSPAINAGIPIEGVMRDIELNDRTAKSDFDMGAYMFIRQSGFPSPPRNLRKE